MTARVGGQPLRDVELLHWCQDLVQAVLLPDGNATLSHHAEGTR
jgi:hypothetical protein